MYRKDKDSCELLIFLLPLPMCWDGTATPSSSIARNELRVCALKASTTPSDPLDKDNFAFGSLKPCWFCFLRVLVLFLKRLQDPLILFYICCLLIFF